MSASLPPSSQKRRRQWPWLLGGVLAIALAGAIAWWVSESSVRRRLQATVAKIDTVETDWRLEDLDRKRILVPDNENLGTQMLAMAGLIGRQMISHPDYDAAWKSVEKSDGARLHAPENLVALQKVVRGLPNYAQVRTSANRLRALSKGNMPLVARPDLLWVTSNEFENSQVRLFLLSETALHAAEGKADESARDLLTVLQSFRAFDDSPNVVDHMLAYSWIRSFSSFFEHMLAIDAIPDAYLEKLQAGLSADDQFNRELAYARAALAQSMTICNKLQTGRFRRNDARLLRSYAPKPPNETIWRRLQWQAEFVLPATVTETEIEGLEITLGVVVNARRPLEEQAKEFLQKRNEPRTEGLAGAIAETQIWKLRARTHVRAAIAGLAAERFRRKHNRWPGGFDDLVADKLLDRPLIDLFSGKPLRFRKLEDGLVIYGVGLDGQDREERLPRFSSTGDTSAMQPNFRLWDSDRRRQPPAAPVRDDPQP